jgi:transcriptional regulator with XRE-family HTH domain
LGPRLRRARLAAGGGAGMDQRELAAALGLSQAAISDYERGRRHPGLSTLLRLSRTLGASLGWLVAGEPPEPASAHAAAVEQTRLVALDFLGRAGMQGPDGILLAAGRPGAAAGGDRSGLPGAISLAAEERRPYAAGTGQETAARRLVLSQGMCPGARAAILYLGPPTACFDPGDLLLLGEVAAEPAGMARTAAARWLVVSTPDGSGQALVAPGSVAPPGTRVLGTVTALLRQV